MKRLIPSLALLVLGCSLSGCGSYNTPSPSPSTSATRFTAVLSPANEVPAIIGAEAAGSGTATITLNLTKDVYGSVTAATADFSVTVIGFPEGTALTAAHIHSGAAGTNGNVLINTGLTPGEAVFATGGGTFTKSGISITVDQANAIMANPSGFYFNIHTTDNPNGVARGQLAPAQ
jgi:hypothetical protein